MKRMHEYKTDIENIARKHADVYAGYGNNGVIEISLTSDQKESAGNIISALREAGYNLTKKGRKFVKILVQSKTVENNINGVWYSFNMTGIIKVTRTIRAGHPEIKKIEQQETFKGKVKAVRYYKNLETGETWKTVEIRSET